MAFLSYHVRIPIFHAFLNISFLLLLISFLIYSSSSPPPSVHGGLLSISSAAHVGEDCSTGLDSLSDYVAKCSYLQTQNKCISQGYIDYLKLFYCVCGKSTLLGFTALASWLLILFYLLGNTASRYFCSSLEGLSDALQLSPTIAGVTLLSLGNGAPDVFSSIVSFMASDSTSGASEVGLSSVLGGAFFVSSVVVGIISVRVPVSGPLVSVDRSGFVRDACFLLVALAAVVAILVSGRIFLWEATCFMCLYFVYVLAVTVPVCCQKNENECAEELHWSLLPTEETVIIVKEVVSDSDKVKEDPTHSCHQFNWILHIIELPLSLLRRLTIPLVSEENWSKPFAVTSVTLAPLLLSVLYNTHITENGGNGSQTQYYRSLEVYLFGGLIGTVLCVAAMESTVRAHPPRRLLLPWVAGGFLMSVIWSYILADELVALLVSFGNILGINPSILGLTVLAWGNSIGDLMTNVAMSISGGQNGAQIAMSGCYAGPLFNILVGLGASLVSSSWSVYPSSYVIPLDTSNFEIIGFLVSGVLWSMVMLTKRGMKLDRALGIGLLSVYVCFLVLRISESMGIIQIDELVRL